jgi:IMP dehydrogenase|tara:strand:+ start:4389 stop:5420 length:1032 start_codon:yes stop_codon:yes gene_type:complete
MDKSLSYDDVLLVPKYSDIRSRSEIDITGDLTNGLSLPLPIISSPMDTITETTMSFIMACMGGSGIIHRYNTIEEQSKMVREASAEIDSVAIGSLGAAVGVTGDYIERAQSLVFAGVKYICVDIAHGHHILMKEALYNLRKALPPNFHIMAGNVATLQGVNDLADWGANSVRCNIGGGSICSTRIQTGHGMPGLQTIFDCAKTDRDVGIIADGGIRNAGDIVKALAAGADAVMCGSLLAGTNETPGNILKDASGSYKVYRGMASKEAQINWRGRYSSFEGISSVVPCRGNVDSLLTDLGKNIKSGFSYSGARNMKELRLKADFTQQTTAGTVESGTHISSKAV